MFEVLPWAIAIAVILLFAAAFSRYDDWPHR